MAINQSRPLFCFLYYLFTLDDIHDQFAKAVNRGLATYFPPSREAGRYVNVIAEPGRFFNESAGTLVVNVYGKRRKTHPEDEYLDDKPGLEGE